MTEKTSKSSGILHDWLITVAIILISFFGVILSLICIFSLPDQTVQPFTGAIFFICSSLIVCFFLVLRWKKEAAIYKDEKASNILIIKETISDKILKWIVAICAFFLVFDGLAVAMICIYALPDKTTQPIAGLLFFLSGCIVLASFVFVVWKNWSSNPLKP